MIRKQHVAALDEIESTFRQFGIERLLQQTGRGAGKRRAGAAVEAPASGKVAGRKKRKAGAAPSEKGAKATRGPGAKKKGGKAGTRGAKKATKRVRGKFEITGDELIIRFVRKLGCPTTEEIRRHWESEGRRGKAENNLTQLVKTGQLKRTKLEGKPGSTYSIP